MNVLQPMDTVLEPLHLTVSMNNSFLSTYYMRDSILSIKDKVLDKGDQILSLCRYSSIEKT